jgi:hypothetical protein
LLLVKVNGIVAIVEKNEKKIIADFHVEGVFMAKNMI